MDTINKYQSLTILLMSMLGILLGQVDLIAEYSEYMITPSLIIMLLLAFTQIPIKDMAKSFKNVKFTLVALTINFIWTPLLIFILSKIFLNYNLDLRIGFIMLMVTPCTDWYLIFTGKAKGNIALGTSILPLNFILQVLLLPLYIILISGSNLNIDILNLSKSVIISLIIPILASIFIRKLYINFKSLDDIEENLYSKASKLQNYFLNAAIIFMFASQGKVLIENPIVLLQLLIPVLLFFIINFIVSQFVGETLKFSYEDKVALSLTTLARNSPIALTIAVSAFPDKPLIALALIIGPLIELPVLFLVSRVLLNKSERKSKIKSLNNLL